MRQAREEPTPDSDLKGCNLTVPKLHILLVQSAYTGTTLRPKYILFGYMDPSTASKGEMKVGGARVLI